MRFPKAVLPLTILPVAKLHHLALTRFHPPLSPNCVAHSSYLLSPSLPTLGLMLTRLAWKSWNCIGLISSLFMCSSRSPRLRKGPIAASLAKAVISEPEKPVAY